MPSANAAPPTPVFHNENCCNFGAGKYPLIYDRFMLNHDGKGVNVLMMDGSVMWDADAEWLKKFASENTNVTLSIPVQ